MKLRYEDVISKSMGDGWYCSNTMIKFKVERWKEEKKETWIMLKRTNQILHEYIQSYIIKLITNL